MVAQRVSVVSVLEHRLFCAKKVPCSLRSEMDTVYYLAGFRILARAVLVMFFLCYQHGSSQDTNLIMRTAM
jgi:hypothetical protein